MSKYDPLFRYLQQLLLTMNKVTLAFSEIEKVLGGPLPASARKYPAWWANDITHVEARAWMNSGWETRDLRLDGSTVDFVRHDVA
jgi:hypothetical protein